MRCHGELKNKVSYLMTIYEGSFKWGPSGI